MTRRMEGAHRPGHFEGVATVVTKLLAGIQPDAAYFGRKDAQQVAVVTRMASDLSLPVTIVPVSTIREADGLALSSRNVRLGRVAREAALAINRSLMAAADVIEAGATDPRPVAAAVRDGLVAAEGVDPEYAEWGAVDDLSEPATIRTGTFLAVAARVDGVRLIDNIHVDDADGDLRVDRGVRIEGRSMLYDRKDE